MLFYTGRRYGLDTLLRVGKVGDVVCNLALMLELKLVRVG